MDFVEADASHIPAISSFFWEAWRQTGPNAPGWAGASEEVIAELTAPDAIRARIGGPARRMFLAIDDDTVVAFAATRLIDQASVELAGIVVRQDMVGEGIGTPLLEAALQAMMGAGFAQLVVRTEATNGRAIGFYESRGFERVADVVEVVEGIEIELGELKREL